MLSAEALIRLLKASGPTTELVRIIEDFRAEAIGEGRRQIAEEVAARHIERECEDKYGSLWDQCRLCGARWTNGTDDAHAPGCALAARSGGECGPVHSGDDGCVFWCVRCGSEARRTRDNPYPEVKHTSAGERGEGES